MDEQISILKKWVADTQEFKGDIGEKQAFFSNCQNNLNHKI